jgi:peptidyl-prolyl cis-trans isomerase C
VQTQFGWHVIKLEETRDVAPPAFDQVKARVEQMVQGKKFKTYVDDLMKTAKVEKSLDGAKPAAPAPAAAGAATATPPAAEKKP